LDSGAGTILGQGGKAESAKVGIAKSFSLKLECYFPKKQAFSKKKVFAGFGVSFCLESKRSLKKRKKVFAGFGASFCPESKRSLIKKKRSSPD